MQERTDLGYKDPVSLLFLERIAALGKDPEEGWEKAVDLEMDWVQRFKILWYYYNMM